MKKIFKFASILTFNIIFFISNTSAMEPIITVKNSSKYKWRATIASETLRTYFNDDTPKNYPVAVSYKSGGAYIVASTKIKLIRLKDKSIVVSIRRVENLKYNEAYVWYFNKNKFYKGEKYQIDIKYVIKAGNTKHCKKTFTYTGTDVLWLTTSKGTTYNNNGCKEITFKKKIITSSVLR
jgi:hypothetical protein